MTNFPVIPFPVSDPAFRNNLDPTRLTVHKLDLFVCPYHSAIGDPFGINSNSVLGAPWAMVCKEGYYDNGMTRSFYSGNTNPSLNCSQTTFGSADEMTVNNCNSNSSSLASFGGIVNGVDDTSCGLGVDAGPFVTCYCIVKMVTSQRSAACIPCPTGTYGSTNGLTTSICSNLCPAGRFGATTALKNSSCSGPCAAGFYCPIGSTSAQQFMCPPGSYCPSAIGAPIPCPSGFFCLSGQTNPGDNPCPLGFYCLQGSSAPSFCTPALSVSGAYIVSTVVGQAGNWSWTCSPGFYGRSIIRACSTVTGFFSGSDITCLPCEPPTAPVSSNLLIKVSESIWRYSCTPGFFGGPLQLTCDPVTGSFGVARLTCTTCYPNATYCPGNDDGGAYPCPAGTWAPATYQKASCPGTCEAGFFCPAGSSSGTAQPCGAVGFYCPVGVGAPVPVPVGYFSIPTTVGTEMQRTGITSCPVDYACSGGVQLPGVTWGVSCATAGDLFAAEAVVGAWIGGPVLNATSPGFTGGILVTITNVARAPGCTNLASGTNLTWDSSAARLRVPIGESLNFADCQTGALVTLRASRIGFPLVQESCTVKIAVSQFIRAPTITDCGPRYVAERSAVGTAVAPAGTAATSPLAALRAVSPNVGTAMLWSANLTLNPSLPFSIDPCSGVVTTLMTLLRRTQKIYTVPIVATNDGRSIGLGTSTATCTLSITVVASPLPPLIANTAFAAPDGAVSGTMLGNVRASDTDDYAIVYYAIVPGSGAGTTFLAVDMLGNVTLSAPLSAFSTGIYAYSAVLNVSTAYIWGLTTLTLTVLAVAPPPVAAAATLFTAELSVAGTFVGSLSAYSASNLALNYTFEAGAFFCPATTIPCFTITAAGRVSVAAGAGGAFLTRGTFVGTYRVTDSNARSDTALLTITVTEVAKAPLWKIPSSGTTLIPANWTFAVDDASLGGSALAGLVAVYAVSLANNGTIVYSIDACTPAVTVAACPFTISSISGVLVVNPGVLGNVLSSTVWGAVTFSPAAPFMYTLRIIALDATYGISIVGFANVTIINILPRTLVGNSSLMKANATVGSVVTNLGAYVTTVYSPTTLRYSLNTAEATAEGDAPTFRITPNGDLVVENATLTNTGFGAPRWNPNTKSVYIITYTVTDSKIARSATGSLQIILSPVNRAPVWGVIPLVFVPERVANVIVGAPLSTLVTDADVALKIGEILTFSIIGGGNGSGLFAIDSASGAVLTLVNTLNFPNVYELIVRVTDVGINGARLSASTSLFVSLIMSTSLPTVNASYSFSIPEHPLIGTVIGRIYATSFATASPLSYALSPAGANVNNPFPIAIRTVAVSNSNGYGELFVSGSPINFSPWSGEGNFQTYQATLTVTDARISTQPLTAGASVTVNVLWVAEAPFFNASILPPAYAPFAFIGASLYIRAFSPPGSNASLLVSGLASVPVFLTASIKNPFLQPFLTYTLDAATPSSSKLFFDIDALSGRVFVKSNSTIISRTSGPFILSVAVTIVGAPIPYTLANGLFDVAKFTVYVAEVNEPAVWTGPIGGLFSAALVRASSIGSTRPNITISELATGTVAFLVAADPNTVGSLWAQTRYSLLPSAGSSDFVLAADTGALTVAALLSWATRPLYFLTISVTDADPISALTVNFDISIVLAQANRITITAVTVANTASGGVNAPSSSIYAAAFPSHAVLLPTEGGSLIVNGSGFAVGATAAVGSFAAGSACVLIDAASMRCDVPAGAGARLLLTIKVGAFSTLAPLSLLIGFLPPILTSVTSANSSILQIPTTAVGATFLINGLNFGPVGTTVALSYGPPGGSLLRYANAPCLVMIAHTQLICMALPGIGANLSFSIAAANSPSLVAFNNTNLRYASPTLNSISAPILSTLGGESIVITGTNFGPATSSPSDVSFTYGNGTTLQATGCIVAAETAHTRLTCSAAPGVGAFLASAITVGGQTTMASRAPFVLSYSPPIVTGLRGAGSSFDTNGNVLLGIIGSNFGPIGTIVNASYIRPDGRFYFATDCRVTVAHTSIECLVAPGTGAGYIWSVSVGAQASAVCALCPTTGYLPPVVASFIGIGAKGAVTEGGQSVIITGRNFGPLNGASVSAFYGTSNFNGTGVFARDFNATLCVVTIAHIEITCTTMAGAGASLTWRVVVDAQTSVQETTSYAVPSITNVAAADANVSATFLSPDGGERILITGLNFAVAQYLGIVTYGQTGYEYRASSCVVTVAHRSIVCSTVAGSGVGHMWVVTVRDQTSSPSAVRTSYAAPIIVSVSPKNINTRYDPASPIILTLATRFLPVKSFSFAIFVQFGNADVSSSVGTPILRTLVPVVPSAGGLAGATNVDGTVNITIALPSFSWTQSGLDVTSTCLLHDGWYYAGQAPSCMVPDLAGAQVGLRLLVLPASLSDVKNASVALAAAVGSYSELSPAASISFNPPTISGVVVSLPPWVMGGNIMGGNTTPCPFANAAPTWDCESKQIYRLEVSGANFGGFAPAITRRLQFCVASNSQPTCVSDASWGPGVEPPLPQGNGPRNDPAPLWVASWSHTSIVAYTNQAAGAVRVSLLSSGVLSTLSFTQAAFGVYENLAPSVVGYMGLDNLFPCAGDNSRIVSIDVAQLAGSTKISILVGGTAATLLTPTGAIATSSLLSLSVPVISAIGPVWTVRFFIPEGQGTTVPIIVVREIGSVVTPSDARVSVSYLPPVLSSARVAEGANGTSWSIFGQPTLSVATPVNVSTDGTSNVELFGTNLGTAPIITLRWLIISPSGVAVAQTITLRGDALTRCDVDRFFSCWAFIAPSGEGTSWTLTLSAGNQATADVAWTFAQPIITSVAAAAPSSRGFSTRGGDVVTIVGVNFGRSAPSLSFGNVTYQPLIYQLPDLPIITFGFLEDARSTWAICGAVVRVSPTNLLCALPEGSGAGLSVAVRVAGVIGTTLRVLSYGAPGVISMTSSAGSPVVEPAWEELLLAAPSTVYALGDTAGGASLTINGFNFGVASPHHCAFLTWAYRSPNNAIHTCNNGEDWLGEGEVSTYYITFWDHERIVFNVHPGLGRKELQLVIRGAALQPPRLNNDTIASPDVPRLAYSRPTVTTLTSGPGVVGPPRISTDIRTLLVINGSGFGPSFFDTSLTINTLPPFGPQLFSSPLPLLCESGQTRPCAPSLMLAYPVVLFHRACAAFALDVYGARVSSLSVDTFFSPGVPLYSGGFGSSCTQSITSISHNAISFYSSPGIGMIHNVTVVIVHSQTAAIRAEPSLTFSYEAPQITNYNPNIVRMRTGQGTAPVVIIIEGFNFGSPALAIQQGWSAAELALVGGLEGIPCSPIQRGLDGETGSPTLLCTVNALTAIAGYANVNVTVAGQSGVASTISGSRKLLLVCDNGFYGKINETCAPCPASNENSPALAGAVCDGFVDYLPNFAAKFTYPRPLPGWFNLNSSDSTTLDWASSHNLLPSDVSMLSVCPASFRDLGRDVCIVPCQPASSCLANNFCSLGYASKPPMFRCTSCANGYFRSATLCARCPDSPAAVIVIVVLVLIIVAGMGYWLNKRQINLAIISIGIDFFQVLAIFAQSSVKWPPQVLALMQILSAFNFNIEIVAPECLVAGISYREKFAFIMFSEWFLSVKHEA